MFMSSGALTRRLITALVFALLSPSCAGAAFEVIWPDARSAGMLERGGPVTGLLSGDDSTHVTLSCGELFAVREAAGGAVVARSTVGGVPVALSTSVLGGALYQERSLSAGAALSFADDATLATAVRVVGIRAQGVEDIWSAALDVGFRRTMLGRVSLSACVENLTHARMGGSPMTARTTLRAGLALDSVRMHLTTTVESGFEPQAVASVELNMTEWMRLRAGAGRSPGRIGLGLGLGRARTRAVVDLAWQWHPRLGVSSFVSITITM